MGFFLAPIISGVLEYLQSFTFSCNIMALCDMIIVVVYLIVFVIGKQLFKKEKKESAKKELEDSEKLEILKEDVDLMERDNIDGILENIQGNTFTSEDHSGLSTSGRA